MCDEKILKAFHDLRDTSPTPDRVADFGNSSRFVATCVKEFLCCVVPFLHGPYIQRLSGLQVRCFKLVKSIKIIGRACVICCRLFLVRGVTECPRQIRLSKSGRRATHLVMSAACHATGQKKRVKQTNIGISLNINADVHIAS